LLQTFSKKRTHCKTVPSPIINGLKYIHTAIDALASVDDDDDDDDDDKDDIYIHYIKTNLYSKMEGISPLTWHPITL
jgi:hypothetical protein